MIKIGIVGARGLSVVGAIKAMPDDAEIVAMCDLDEGALEAAKAAIGKEDLQLYRIYGDMLEKAD
ncbi:MAG: gfo/Idh/MocA family oxidoreductase, partial [Clostridia bacterium]|nr:gfo/Idh/MocA family oxidoreductase [Clostridia bacterium]